MEHLSNITKTVPISTRIFEIGSFEIEKLEESSPGQSVPPEEVSQLESKTMHKDEEGDQYREKK